MTSGVAQLADFVSELTWEDVPPTVRRRVTEITLDTLASAIAGRHGDETGQVEALARAIADVGTSTVLGGRPASAAAAVLVNGYQVTAVTVCDIYRPALCHITPEVLPPALAVSEQLRSRGQDLLVATAAGLEVTARIGRALNYSAFRERGWHSPGVIGPFGGAASAGRLLGLDSTAQRHAFGLAGSQAAGTFAHWGTPTIKFHQSRGSLSGLMAAQLAAQGFLSADDILENPDGGLFHSYSDGGDAGSLVRGLGSEWELEAIGLRRWPAASSIQTMISGIFAILDQNDVATDEVRKVSVELSPNVYRMHGELPWTTKFSAQLSAPYVAAVVVHDRQCWLEQFAPERIADPHLDAFARERVVVTENPDLQGTSSIVRLHLEDGTMLEDVRSLPKGDPDDPLTMTEIEAKFREACRGVLDAAAADRAWVLWAEVGDCDDLSPLIGALGAPSR